MELEVGNALLDRRDDGGVYFNVVLQCSSGSPVQWSMCTLCKYSVTPDWFIREARAEIVTVACIV